MGTLCQRSLMVGSVGVGFAYLPTLGQCWAGMLKMEIGVKNVFVENKVWVDVSPVVAEVLRMTIGLMIRL